MGIVVQKYGGSSVADVAKIGLVADKIVATKKLGHDVVVVVSAMGKTTDQLLALAKQVDENPPRRELDMLLTTGERVTMALMSMAIQKRGVDAISFTGSQSGIITNDRHFDARILEVRPHRIEDELARGRVVIVAGYQGMSYRREITTLGRGGSDTTAIALAAALGAERAEIYSDVDGVYSADPRVVADAAHLPALSYESMQEMAASGAKVLNAAAVEFAKRAGIQIHARSTFDGRRETIVTNEVRSEQRCVVGQKNLVRVNVHQLAQFETALSICARAGAVPVDAEIHANRGNFLVVLGVTPDWHKARAELAAALGADISFEDGIGTVCVTGEGVGQDPAVFNALISAAKSSNAQEIRLRSNDRRVMLVTNSELVDATTAATHARLALKNAE